MKIQIIVVLLIATTFLKAMEFRVGSATFNWQMGMTFMQTDFEMDATVYSISEQHNNFSDSKFYYFYNADIYQSDAMDQMTTLITTPLTFDFPFIGSFNDAVAQYTSIPVPSDYKIRGLDLNFGVGYDLFRDSKGLIGVGINTGFSMPVMKMQNLQKSAMITYDLLDNTETSIMTYKLGPIIHVNYEIVPKFLLYASATIGLQTGSIENEWVKSSFDVDGSYTFIDLGLRYTPWSSTKDLGWIRLDPKLFFTAGYNYKKWEMDDAALDAFNIAEFSTGGLFTNSFDTNYFYLGVGYDF